MGAGGRIVSATGVFVALVVACSSYGGEDAPSGPTPDAGTDANGGCPSGTADCDGRLETMCETTTSTDPSNCGYCGHACPARANAFPTCTNGACSIGCNTGFSDCDGNVDNGCETPVRDDAMNCGACGHACVGTSCADSLCQPSGVTANAGSIMLLALGVDDVFFATAANEIRSAKKTGSTFTDLATVSNTIRAFAVDGDYLYAAYSQVYRCPIADCTSSTLKPIYMRPPGGGVPGNFSVAFDDAFVYSAPFDNLLTGPSFVYEETRDQLLTDGGGTMVAQTPLVIMGVAAGTDEVYARSFYQGRLFVAPKKGGDGGVTEIGEGGVDDIVAAGSVLVTREGLHVYGCPAPCTKKTELFAGSTTTGNVRAVVVDQVNVYAAFEGTQGNGFADGSIVRCALAGCNGAPLVLAKGQMQPATVAIDATYVYWGNSDGTLRRVAK